MIPPLQFMDRVYLMVWLDHVRLKKAREKDLEAAIVNYLNWLAQVANDI
jgi:hypothetical protein